VSPLFQSLDSALISRFTFTESNAIVIDVVACRRCRVCCANLRIGKWQIALPGDELFNVAFSGLANPEH
jgi:hypothetical protein